MNVFVLALVKCSGKLQLLRGRYESPRAEYAQCGRCINGKPEQSNGLTRIHRESFAFCKFGSSGVGTLVTERAVFCASSKGISLPHTDALLLQLVVTAAACRVETPNTKRPSLNFQIMNSISSPTMDNTGDMKNAQSFCFPIRCLEDGRIKLVPFRVSPHFSPLNPSDNPEAIKVPKIMNHVDHEYLKALPHSYLAGSKHRSSMHSD
jgi:hypothetical protein